MTYVLLAGTPPPDQVRGSALPYKSQTPKSYPTPQPRAYTARMTHEPASAHPYASLSLAQMIGLNLAKLYAWLVRFEASGETKVPSDIAHMVTSTDWLVQAFIRMLASQQLERAGFTFAALAMRVPNCSREPAAHIELAQGCSPAELLARLETTMENFDRAEAIASTLARVIVFALVYVSPETRRTSCIAPLSIRLDAGRSARPIGAASVANRREIKTCRSSQGPPDPWPPPYPSIPDLIWDPCLKSSSQLVA